MRNNHSKCPDSDLLPDTGELSSWTVSAIVSVSFWFSVPQNFFVLLTPNTWAIWYPRAVWRFFVHDGRCYDGLIVTVRLLNPSGKKRVREAVFTVFLCVTIVRFVSVLWLEAVPLNQALDLQLITLPFWFVMFSTYGLKQDQTFGFPDSHLT